MRLFRHIMDDYTCSQHCGYGFRVVESCLSPFDLITAGVAMVPLWLVLLCKWHLPWYYLFSIFAGELLVQFAVGFALSVPLMVRTARRAAKCRECGAPMLGPGRHFDPLGSKAPEQQDIVMLVGFVAVNIAILAVLLSGKAMEVLTS